MGFFSLEKYSYPPALLKCGKLNQTNNSASVSVFLECPKSVHGKNKKFTFFVTKGALFSCM